MLRSFFSTLEYMLPPVTRWTLVGLAALFVLQALLLRVVPADLLILYPTGIEKIHLWTLLTYGLFHGSLTHLLVNGIQLFFFGPIVERSIGARRMIWLLALSVLAGGLAHTAAYWGAPVGLLGFSGACFAIMVGCLFFAPNATVYLYFAIPLKMKYLVVGMVVLEVVLLFGNSGSGISHLGHLAGAAVGFVLLRWPWLFDKLPGGGGGGGGFGGGGRRKRVKSRRISMGHPGRSENASDLYDDPHWRLDQ